MDFLKAEKKQRVRGSAWERDAEKSSVSVYRCCFAAFSGTEPNYIKQCTVLLISTQVAKKSPKIIKYIV